MNELIKRSIIAIFAIPLLLFIYFFGNLPLLIFLVILSMLSAYELKKMCHNKEITIQYFIIPLSGLLCYFSAIYNFQWSLYILFLSLLIISAEDIFKSNIQNAFLRMSASLWILIYCSFSFGFAYKIHELKNGQYYLPLLAIMIWITDSFAYFVGMSLGKHRGIFKVSPKKSIEGFIGGFSFSIIFSVLAHFLFPQQLPLPISLLIAFCAGTIGQFGDLLESLIKRDFNVKDSSNLIPGHGGILDRFDSFIVTAPFFYILYKIILEI